VVQDGKHTDPAAQAAASAASELRRDVDAIRADLGALREDLTAIVNSAVNAGKAQAGDATERLTQAARSRLDQMGTAWEDMNLRGREALDQVQSRIEEHPLQSVGIAFAAGLLLGVIVRR
jgi:ElaB/YqjD/DUF883 family membrane-anchored ribosome-binding protein